jgi:hypothetical protein
MTASARPIGTITALVLLVAACRAGAPIAPAILPPPTLPAPSVTSQWVSMQATVNGLVAENRAAAAESSLAQFARDFPRTPEGDRARWWRTLMRTDPRVTSGDAALAIVQIDSLLADSIALEIRAEAVLLKRNIAAIDSVRRTEARRRAQATQLAADRLDELKTVRDSMSKLTSEIERLRRRLRAP